MNKTKSFNGPGTGCPNFKGLQRPPTNPHTVGAGFSGKAGPYHVPVPSGRKPAFVTDLDPAQEQLWGFKVRAALFQACAQGCVPENLDAGGNLPMTDAGSHTHEPLRSASGSVSKVATQFSIRNSRQERCEHALDNPSLSPDLTMFGRRGGLDLTSLHDIYPQAPRCQQLKLKNSSLSTPKRTH